MSGKIRLPKTTQQHLTVGIPRGMGYSRYETLWRVFFARLGIKTVVSAPTNLQTVKRGEARAVSEMCLAMKIYLGHVDALVGHCDMVFVPRIRDFGVLRVMCTNFESLPDVVSAVFYDTGLKVLSYNVFDIDEPKPEHERQAMIAMAKSLGFSHRVAKNAYKAARKAQDDKDAKAAEQAEALYKKKGLKLMLVAHSYVLEDAYFGKPVIDYLEKSGATVIRADQVSRPQALRVAAKVSPTLKWQVSRELVGSLAMHHEQIDGAVLLSVYPCALDSMVNDMILRKNSMSGLPILQLTLDAQSGTAGIETRLESFMDILTMRQEAHHA